MKAIFPAILFSALLLFSVPASAQRLSRLMQERAQLHEDWEYYQEQNNAFFGGKSKDDLLNIVKVQQSIIDKDNEIMEEVRSLNVNTQKGLRAELEATKDQLASAKVKIGAQEKQLTNITELYNTSLSDISTQSSYKNTAFTVILILLCITALLAFKLKKSAGRRQDLSELCLSDSITDAENYIAKLETIGRLKESGLITEEDYRVQKDKILAAL